MLWTLVSRFYVLLGNTWVIPCTFFEVIYILLFSILTSHCTKYIMVIMNDKINIFVDYLLEEKFRIT